MVQNIRNEFIASLVLRIVVSICIASHGVHRLLTNGSEPFGLWLIEQGIPFGPVVAWSITFFEILAAPFLALGKKLEFLTPIFISIYFMGILMVHLQHGWFVVGSGRNGSEYSVLMIAALFSIGFPHYHKLKSLFKS